MIASSRALLDWVVREQALAADRITLVQESDVTGFVGDAGKVTGVTVKSGGGRPPSWRPTWWSTPRAAAPG
ncbi:hypothetical protein NKH77_11420 [Streptomyces sp. M19]